MKAKGAHAGALLGPGATPYSAKAQSGAGGEHNSEATGSGKHPAAGGRMATGSSSLKPLEVRDGSLIIVHPTGASTHGRGAWLLHQPCLRRGRNGCRTATAVIFNSAGFTSQHTKEQKCEGCGHKLPPEAMHGVAIRYGIEPIDGIAHVIHHRPDLPDLALHIMVAHTVDGHMRYTYAHAAGRTCGVGRIHRYPTQLDATCLVAAQVSKCCAPFQVQHRGQGNC